jgi:hypothetical protein
MCTGEILLVSVLKSDTSQCFYSDTYACIANCECNVDEIFGSAAKNAWDFSFQRMVPN